MKSSGVTPRETPLHTVLLHFTANSRWSGVPESPVTDFQKTNAAPREAHKRSQQPAIPKTAGVKFTVLFRSPFPQRKTTEEKNIMNVLFCCDKLFSIGTNWCCQFRHPDGVFMDLLPSINNMPCCVQYDISCSFKFAVSLWFCNSGLYQFSHGVPLVSPVRVPNFVNFPHVSYT